MTAQPSFPIPDNIGQLPPDEARRYFSLLSVDQLANFPVDRIRDNTAVFEAYVEAYRNAYDTGVQRYQENQFQEPQRPTATPAAPPAVNRGNVAGGSYGPATRLPPGGSTAPRDVGTLKGQLGVPPPPQQRSVVPGGSIERTTETVRPPGPQAQATTGAPQPTLVQINGERPPPPPGYSPAPADRPAPPPGYSGAPRNALSPPQFQAPRVVGDYEWFTQATGRPPDQTLVNVPGEGPRVVGDDAGFLNIVRRVLDPEGAEAMAEQQQAITAQNREAYEQMRRERSLTLKVGDWTRAFLNGLFFGGADELFGYMAGVQALLTGGDYEAARQMRTDWERQQHARFLQENPVGGLITEMAGAIPTAAFGASWAARGSLTLGQQIARGALVGGAETGFYGFNIGDGDLAQRLRSAVSLGLPGTAIGGAIPLVAPAFTRGIAATYGSIVHPWRTFVTGRTRPAAGVIPAERIASANRFQLSTGQGAPLTRGQATGNVTQQAREQSMAQGARGDYLANEMNAAFNVQNASVRAAAERLSVELAGGARNYTAAEMGAAVAQRIARIAQTSKDNAGRLYARAEELNPVISPATAEFVPQNVAARLINNTDDFMFDATLHPTAFAAMREIDRLPTLGRFAEGGIVPLTEIRRIQKRINSMSAPTPADNLALQHVRRAYDDSIVDMVDNQLFMGDDRAIAMMREGNQWYSHYLSLTRPRKHDDIGQFIAKIVEGNRSPEEIANWLVGANLAQPSGKSIRAAQRLREIVGVDSEEWNALRSATFVRMISRADNFEEGVFTAERIANNISGFLGGRGEGLAAVLFTSAERETMQAFANTLRMLAPEVNATNPSRSAAHVIRQLAPYARFAQGAAGFAIGNWVGGAIALIGAPIAELATRRIALSRALNPNAAEPFLRNPDVASRALIAAMGGANVTLMPRREQIGTAISGAIPAMAP